MSEINITVNGLGFAYDKQVSVLKNISFTASEQEAIGIIGANGAGKSTLLKLLVGLELAFTGSIKVEGRPVEEKSLPWIREKIGYVFQDSENQLFMSTAFEDVAFGPRNYGLPEAEVQKRVHEALSQVGALALQDKQIFKMSGGEKKLVAIATALAMSPDILLMDEPTASLDPRNRRQLIQLFNSFHYLKLVTTHDLDFILDTCERVLLLADGCIVADGKATEILADKELLEAYGLELPLSFSR